MAKGKTLKLGKAFRTIDISREGKLRAAVQNAITVLDQYDDHHGRDEQLDALVRNLHGVLEATQ